jgi:biopolymer transport protein ExbB
VIFLKSMLDQINQEFQTLNSEGGWVFWCLLALAFGISFAIISIWGLLRLPNTPVINGAQWRDLLLEGSRSMDLLKTLRKKISEKKLGGQLNQIEAQMFSSLKRRIPFTFVLITTAPMVGLLGTVSGMNTTFSGMADASSAGPSSVIAEGVSEALITTSTGLMIAIPSYIILFYLWVQYRRLRHGFRLIESRLSE